MEKENELTKNLLECNPFDFASFSLEKHLYMREFDVEQWYPWIENFTFRTKFLNLDTDEARAIISRYRWYMDDKNANLLPPTNPHIDTLTKKIRKNLEDFPNGAFIRLSSRSPKDAPMNKSFTRMRDLISSETSKLSNNEFFDISPNDKLRALYNAIGRGLISHNADDAIWLLCNSERVFSDLLHALDKDEKYWSMKLIIREWVELDPGLEFRAFVVNKILTAIAQYNDILYYPELQGREESLAKQILEFFKTVCPHINYAHYIIDFVILPGNDIKVIEINPFGPVTGAPLYEYKTERFLLQGGVDVWNDLEEKSLPKSCTDKEKEMIEKGLPVFRLRTEVLPTVTNEYISVMFSDLLSLMKETKEKEKPIEEPVQETKENKGCIVS